MWVGMLSKIEKNRSKFYDKDNKPVKTATEKETTEATKEVQVYKSKRNRVKWQRAFKKIKETAKVVSTMQEALHRKKIKGEVEPSPLLIALSELSRRACYTTNRKRMGPGNSALSSTRLKRPGHADHAPKLFEQTTNTTNLNMEEKESQLQLQRSFFQFSTDVLGHAFRVACMPVLKKNPEDRTEAEIHAVAHIIRSLHFFTVLDDESLNFLLVNSKLHTLNAGEILYKRGDEPKMVWCILRGTLSVVVRHMGLNFTACDLYSGTSVGEEAVALQSIQKNTVMATKPTILLALPRYPELLARIKKEMIEVKIKFLENISIFSGIVNSEALHLLAEHLRVVRVKDNTAVCKEGTPITHLLLVKSGHLRTLKMIPHTGNSQTGRSSRGRKLLVEVQTLAPTDFFGENSFRHMPNNAIRSLRGARKKKRNSFGKKENDEPTYGTYLASLVSKTYCELYEIPIPTVHAILPKEVTKKLIIYGTEREQLYNSERLGSDLKTTIQMQRERELALKSQTYLSEGSNVNMTNKLGFT
jgi:CRP-like cAMP-binding protein